MRQISTLLHPGLPVRTAERYQALSVGLLTRYTPVVFLEDNVAQVCTHCGGKSLQELDSYSASMSTSLPLDSCYHLVLEAMGDISGRIQVRYDWVSATGQAAIRVSIAEPLWKSNLDLRLQARDLNRVSLGLLEASTSMPQLPFSTIPRV
jgi:hypothetical protein